MLLRPTNHPRSGMLSTLIAGIAFLTLAFGASLALAQGGHGGGGGGRGGGAGGSHVSGDSHSSHDSGHESHSTSARGPKGKRGTREAGSGKGSGRSLRGVFRDLDKGARAKTPSTSKAKGKAVTSTSKGKRKPTTKAVAGTKKATPRGKKPTTVSAGKGKPTVKAAAEEPGGRPADKGPPGDKGEGKPVTAGIKKGVLYGDMYVVVREELNGVPEYVEFVLDNGEKISVVQVYFTDADGTLVCCVDRDSATGDLIISEAQPIAEVELGRLSVSRSDIIVLAKQLDDAIEAINFALSNPVADGLEPVTLDAAGRIVLTYVDESTGEDTTKTIDSPIQNLALYQDVMEDGELTGIVDPLQNLPTELSHLTTSDDATPDADDLASAASFFAAASDKTIPISVDTVVYMNSILGINAVDMKTGEVTEYLDYSAILQDDQYDRSSVYTDVYVTFVETVNGDLVVRNPVDPSTGLPTQEVSLYDAVFGGEDLQASNIAAFTTAADDAREVVNFLHEHSPPPATETLTTGSVNAQQ